MMGRSPDGIAFPAVLLAFASLGTPAAGATTEAEEHDVRGAIVSDAGAASSEVGTTPSEVDGNSNEDSGDGGEGLSTAFALLAPSEDVVRRESGAPLAYELEGVADVAESPSPTRSEESALPDLSLVDGSVGAGNGVGSAAPLEGAAEGDVQAVATTPQVVSADTVTLDSRLLRGLRTDFVARLENVAERMWNEHGMRVEVVEGYRTPQRQQALFAQGRTTEGPVVTWTRNSLHSAGAAADLYVDGSPVSPEQAVLLARVAREEGLRTLHPFDSGHIQMEGVARRGAPESALPRDLPSAPAAPQLPKGVAPVAPVAQPARPARPGGLVLNELPPAVNGEERVGGMAGAEAPTAARSQSPAEMVRALLGSHAERLQQAQRDGSRGDVEAARGSVVAGGESGSVDAMGKAVGRSGPGEAAHAAVADIEPGLASTQPDRPAVAMGGKGGSAIRPAPPVTDPSAIMARFEGAHDAAYRRLHVPIEGLGGPASLQLGLRGGTVDAALTVGDPLLANDLRGNLHELRQTLASRGIETAGMTVRVAPDGARLASSTADLTAALPELGGTNASSESRSGDSRQQSTRNGQPHFADDLDDEPTSRRRDGQSRRNPQEK